MSAIVRQLAEELCGGRLAFLLEGGYALSGVLRGHRGGTRRPPRSDRHPSCPSAVDLQRPAAASTGILAPVIQVHRANFPNLGAA